MKDFFELPVSQATVVKATQAGADILQPTVQDIGQAIARSAVAHADESGLRVAKKLHWLHVLATDALTWMGCHPKRGGEAFESLALLQQFKGVLVHDGWMPYKALDCQHALCNQHHLRELVYLLEEQDQAWAWCMTAGCPTRHWIASTPCATSTTCASWSTSWRNKTKLGLVT